MEFNGINLSESGQTFQVFDLEATEADAERLENETGVPAPIRAAVVLVTLLRSSHLTFDASAKPTDVELVAATVRGGFAVATVELDVATAGWEDLVAGLVEEANKAAAGFVRTETAAAEMAMHLADMALAVTLHLAKNAKGQVVA